MSKLTTDLVIDALRASDGNRSAAARRLGVAYNTMLWYERRYPAVAAAVVRDPAQAAANATPPRYPRLAAAVAALGTIDEAAARLGVSRRTVTYWRNGRAPSATALARFPELFDALRTDLSSAS